jgi:hypothetical protein
MRHKSLRQVALCVNRRTVVLLRTTLYRQFKEKKNTVYYIPKTCVGSCLGVSLQNFGLKLVLLAYMCSDCVFKSLV